MTPTTAARPGVSMPDPFFERETKIEDLTERKLFECVDREPLKGLLHPEHSRVLTLKDGQTFSLTAGDFACVYVIIKGYLLIRSPSDFGFKDDVFVAWRGPEQIIGEMRSLYKPAPSTAIIETCNETCELLEMRNDTLMQLADNQCPIIYRNIARLLVEKLTVERHRSEVINTSPAVMQVAQALIYLAKERCGGNVFETAGEIKIPGTILQEQLGEYLGAGRKSVNLALSAFKNAHVIGEKEENRLTSEFTIRNPTELLKIANDRATMEKYRPPKKRARKK